LVEQGFVLAHGVGGVQDLPLPRSLAIAGSVAALVLSFIVLAYAWRQPRFATAPFRAAPGWLSNLVDSTPWRIAWRCFGFAVFGFALMAAAFGNDSLNNPFIYMFFVFLWVAPVPLSVLFGPFWKAVSPVRTIHLGVAKLTGSAPSQGILTYPARLGYWPATFGLFAFVWFELVYPSNNELGPVRLWFAAYIAIMLVGGAVFGDTFFARADPFEVYSSLVAKLSIWGRHGEQLVIRSPLANLHTVVPRPGLVAVVGVLLGSTAFDSFSGSTRWAGFLQDSSLSETLLNNLALLAFCVAVPGLIALGSMLTGAGETPRKQLPGLFAHSIIPIIVGYIVAHYFTFLVHSGQQTLITMSDPFETGANWFGTADWTINYWLNFHATLVANIKVLGVVIGHVLAVVAAHDRAISILPERHQIRGQLPLLAVMVFFTAGGLYLLFSS
jgi:hypothetical protein